MNTKLTNWICPACRRPFKHKQQAHSCVTTWTRLDDKKTVVQLIYRKLIGHVKEFGDVKISVPKVTITFVSKGTFAESARDKSPART